MERPVPGLGRKEGGMTRRHPRSLERNLWVQDVQCLPQARGEDSPPHPLANKSTFYAGRNSTI